jgi:hypothetical protein
MIRTLLILSLLSLAACMGEPRGPGVGGAPGVREYDAWHVPNAVKERDADCYYTPRVPTCGATTAY